MSARAIPVERRMASLIGRILRQRNPLIGKMACIKLNGYKGSNLYGNILDVDYKGCPHRIRIQYGDPKLKGSVVQPHQYEFRWLAEDEED